MFVCYLTFTNFCCESQYFIVKLWISSQKSNSFTVNSFLRLIYLPKWWVFILLILCRVNMIYFSFLFHLKMFVVLFISKIIRLSVNSRPNLYFAYVIHKSSICELQCKIMCFTRNKRPLTHEMQLFLWHFASWGSPTHEIHDLALYFTSLNLC